MNDTGTHENHYANPGNAGGSFWTRVGDTIRVRMIAGLLLLVPVVVTLWVLQLLFGMFQSLVAPLSVFLTKTAEVPRSVTLLISVVALVLLIYITGVLSAHVFGKRLMKLAERTLLRIPVVKNVYSATKQAVDLMSQSNRTAFKSVVLVEFPMKGAKAIAFMIGTTTDQNGKLFYKVLVPTSPSPLTAFLLFLEPDQVEKTDISVEDGIKMIVSGGIVSPDRINISPSDKT
jgi:uncharacterized membrane protein